MKRFLIASTPSDSHTWNLVFLKLLLEEHGHEVVNAGNCMPIDALVEQCLERRPDYLLVSSVNGHGLREGLAIARALASEPALAGLASIIGGKLNTRGSDEAAMERALTEAGFSHVFQGERAVESFKALLRSIEAADGVLERAQACALGAAPAPLPAAAPAYAS